MSLAQYIMCTLNTCFTYLNVRCGFFSVCCLRKQVKFVYKNQCFNVIGNMCCQCIYWVVIGEGLLLSAWCFRVKIKCTTIDWCTLQFALHMFVFAYTGRTKVT